MNQPNISSKTLTFTLMAKQNSTTTSCFIQPKMSIDNDMGELYGAIYDLREGFRYRLTAQKDGVQSIFINHTNIGINMGGAVFMDPVQNSTLTQNDMLLTTTVYTAKNSVNVVRVP